MPDERLDRFYGSDTTSEMQPAESGATPRYSGQSANDAFEYIPTGAPLNTHGLLDDHETDLHNTISTQKSTRTADSGSPLFLPLQSNRSIERPSYGVDTTLHTTVQDSNRGAAAEVDLGKRWSDLQNSSSNINYNDHINGRPDQLSQHQPNEVPHDQTTKHYLSVSSTSTGDHTKETIRAAKTVRHHFTTSEQTKFSGQHHTAQNGPFKATSSATAYPPAQRLVVRTTKRKYTKLQNQHLQDTHFFFNGRLMTGGDRVWPLLGSIVLLLGLGGLWLGTTGVWIWRDGLGGGGAGRGGKASVIIFGYLMGVCFGAMMATAFRDPGEIRKSPGQAHEINY